MNTDLTSFLCSMKVKGREDWPQAQLSPELSPVQGCAPTTPLSERAELLALLEQPCAFTDTNRTTTLIISSRAQAGLNLKLSFFLGINSMLCSCSKPLKSSPYLLSFPACLLCLPAIFKKTHSLLSLLFAVQDQKLYFPSTYLCIYGFSCFLCCFCTLGSWEHFQWSSQPKISSQITEMLTCFEIWITDTYFKRVSVFLSFLLWWISYSFDTMIE